jgi:soluble lytic murein transglycosylase-like protein
LQRKLSVNHFIINTLKVITLLACTQSIAADLLTANPRHAEISAIQLTSVDESIATEISANLNEAAISDDTAATEPTSDALSNSASETLKAIDAQSTDNTTATTQAQTTAPVNKPTSLKSNAYAQLVNLAFKGKGVNGVSNYAEAAAQFCQEARDNNDANAQFALGWLYMNGRGVEKNADIAALFFAKAAQQGHTSAQNWLATSNGSPTLATLPACMFAPVAVTVKVDSTDLVEEQNSKPFYVKGPIYKLVSKIAPRFNIDTDLAMAFIAVESGFNPKARSPKNAQGLMQLIPETAARFNVKDAYNPEDNIKGGLAYLQWLLAYFQGDVKLVAAAYNSGENAVDRYKGVPPYPETKKYVQKIASLYKKNYHPFRENATLGKKSAIVKAG